jgi:hypothetical protein
VVVAGLHSKILLGRAVVAAVATELKIILPAQQQQTELTELVVVAAEVNRALRQMPLEAEMVS